MTNRLEKHTRLRTVLATGILISMSASAGFAQTPAAGNAAKAPAFKAHELSKAEFEALLAKPDKLLIVDVRRPDELTNIGGFPVYLSVQAAELEKSLAFIPKDRTIVTVSNHAARGGKSADLLASKGFKVAGTIGAQTYEQQGGALTRIAPPPPKPQTVAGVAPQ